MKYIYFLSIFCFLEFLIILFDKGRVYRAFAKLFFWTKQKGLIYTAKKSAKYLAKKIFKIISQSKYIFKQKFGRQKKHIHIAFRVSGGLGDYLIFANWFEYFRNAFSENVFYDLYFNEKIAFSVFNYDILRANFFYEKDCHFNESAYDVVFKFMILPELIKFNDKAVQKTDVLLYDYLQKNRKYCAENQFIFANMPFTIRFAEQKALAKGKKRMHQADVIDYFKIDDEYKFKIFIDKNENENEYLASVGLLGKKFITIHRGWDVLNEIDSHVKCWNTQSCKDLICSIKKTFPSYKVVAIGSSQKQFPICFDADINLVGKTTMEHIKILLKHASVHIDNEGGMVHLRHAMKAGRSVVLFGPTSKEFFGYKENINISSNVCCVPCEHLSADWTHKCEKTGTNDNPCMKAITTNCVLKALSDALK